MEPLTTASGNQPDGVARQPCCIVSAHRGIVICALHDFAERIVAPVEDFADPRRGIKTRQPLYPAGRRDCRPASWKFPGVNRVKRCLISDPLSSKRACAFTADVVTRKLFFMIGRTLFCRFTALFHSCTHTSQGQRTAISQAFAKKR